MGVYQDKKNMEIVKDNGKVILKHNSKIVEEYNLNWKIKLMIIIKKFKNTKNLLLVNKQKEFKRGH